MITKEKEKIDLAFENYDIIIKKSKGKFATLDDWLLKESNIFLKETNSSKKNIYLKYKRGQIIKVDFGVNIGTELSHTHFAIVLNNDDTKYTDNITVVPLTSKNGYRRVNLGNLIANHTNNSKYQNNTYAYITQIKTISKKRILLNNKKIICDDNTLSLLDKEITEYLTKVK